MNIQDLQSRSHLTELQIQSLLSPSPEEDRIQLLDDSVALHLEHCETCRAKLEQSAAEPWLWDSASEILTELSLNRSQDANADDTRPVPSAPSNLNWEAELADGPSAELDELDLAEEVVQTLLDRPSHPEMMGRIQDYEIERAIGTGGSGIVFKGFDRELNRPVAIKMLAPRYSSIGAARKRFSREARAAAAICHENVVSIHRIDSSASHPFIVMPYVGGGSLQQFVEKQGPLDPVQVVQIGKQIAAGLAAAHDVGVIHRDIKPANILLENGCNRVLISDFGLAQVESDISLTRTGFIAGTPFYMSPEQAQGRPTDARSDLFALGGILYFMSTGRPPFRANNAMAVLNKICKEKLIDVRHWNPEIPAPLANAIHTLLEKQVDHRFRSAAQVTQMMTEYLAHLQQPTVRKQPRVSAPKSMQRNRFRWIGLAAVIAAFATFLTVGGWSAGWFDSQNPNRIGETAPSDSAGDPRSPLAIGDTDEAFADRVNVLVKEMDSLEQVAPTSTEGSDATDWEIQSIRRALEQLEQEQGDDDWPR